MALKTVDIDHVRIRTYEPQDQEAVNRLYTDGLLGGQIPPGDTGADIENIDEAYLHSEMTHFWVAEYEGRVVGMVGVAEEERHLAEIRRLRVEKPFQHSDIGIKLMEMALAFCRHHAYLKVVLDTRIERGPAMAIFEKFAFQHHRTKTVHGKELLEFYLDLYRQSKEGEGEE